MRVHAVDLINASWGMRSLNEWLIETVIALARELSEQAGMAGDDDAGHAFAKMYMSAAKTTVNQLGEAAHAVGNSSEALLHNAYEYMATESKIAAEMLAAMGESGAATTPRNRPQECEPAPRGRGNDLPDAIGETSAVGRRSWDGGSSGGTKAERDYQRRTADYPEKKCSSTRAGRRKARSWLTCYARPTAWPSTPNS